LLREALSRVVNEIGQRLCSVHQLPDLLQDYIASSEKVPAVLPYTLNQAQRSCLSSFFLFLLTPLDREFRVSPIHLSAAASAVAWERVRILVDDIARVLRESGRRFAFFMAVDGTQATPYLLIRSSNVFEISAGPDRSDWQSLK
jgi:hypothetical protein